MKRGCTAVQRTVTNGGMLECPDSLGEKSENVDFDGFSKTRSINYSGEMLVCAKRDVPL